MACPTIADNVDYNCNGAHKIVVTGDSFVKGVPFEDGGYVTYVDQRLAFSRTANIGVSGITSQRLLREFKKNLKKNKVGPTKKKLAEADLVIIDVSRNDYWKDVRPAQTVTNIRRLVKFLSKQAPLDSKVPPLVVVATPTPTTRGFQSPFIREVTRLLLKLNSSKFPVHVRFDKVKTKFISGDGLHPTKAGYKKNG